ncbi:hypothetical protein KIH31_04175 [Paenarthrobacter sp. DKR-5]|nr:hypothetical protein [Paenarthrobacter sp. DKR-5]
MRCSIRFGRLGGAVQDDQGDIVAYTREDLHAVLAAQLGTFAGDGRIRALYEEMISEWVQTSDDPGGEYARYFDGGPIATRADLTAAMMWAKGRTI